LGRRRCSGIWPPSNPAFTLPLPERANWPLWPRPAVLPRPEPIPRPTRIRSLRAPSAGLMSFRRMTCLLLDSNQVVHLVDQTAHARGILELAHIVDLAQAQRLDAEAMPLLGPAQALHQANA